MQQQEFETLLAPDSCVLIGAIKSPAVASNILRLFKGKHSRIVLQDVVLQEAEKILKKPKEEIITKISSILGKEVYIFSTTPEMREEAHRIEKQFGVCHFPDSIILTAAKTFSWTILTMDKNMLRTANWEGILAFNPLRVRSY